MPDDDGLSDAERIAIGLDPLQGDHLYDRDDLWRILERLGCEQSDSLPTTVWDHVNWSCPVDECDGRLGLIDTRMRGLPANLDDLDDSVPDESKAYLRLAEAQTPTEPLVACAECGNAYEGNFRRLRSSDEGNLPEPRIEKTIDPASRVASLLLSASGNSDTLEITINTDDGRVIIDGADEVISHLNRKISPSSDSGDTNSDDETSSNDDTVVKVNERVENEWVKETTSFDRVITVMRRAYEPQTVETIADRANTAVLVTQMYLNHLLKVGYVEEITDSQQNEVKYKRSELSLALEQARNLLTEGDADLIEERISEMQEELQEYRERFGVKSPEDAEMMDDVNHETLREWQTTRRNLGFAKAALALNDMNNHPNFESDES